MVLILGYILLIPFMIKFLQKEKIERAQNEQEAALKRLPQGSSVDKAGLINLTKEKSDPSTISIPQVVDSNKIIFKTRHSKNGKIVSIDSAILISIDGKQVYNGIIKKNVSELTNLPMSICSTEKFFEKLSSLLKMKNAARVRDDFQYELEGNTASRIIVLDMEHKTSTNTITEAVIQLLGGIQLKSNKVNPKIQEYLKHQFSLSNKDLDRFKEERGF